MGKINIEFKEELMGLYFTGIYGVGLYGGHIDENTVIFYDLDGGAIVRASATALNNKSRALDKYDDTFVMHLTNGMHDAGINGQEVFEVEEAYMEKIDEVYDQEMAYY